ncbi:uncharacterized protein L969DRAFT_100364 [Mixia osmundae IAM 14324]|uniref:EF-hand domain-containing protein n=1 Tax=Mixia osmundae (strain CBS 9802 / IAM 14324 / JCM 22182 / KY 12970) TaxID=764103 RepID=G7DSQ9_MIXOS|nr:uncharacterized protein L969DRAFT_100364 [Mixia osmundae IAM 14324]KEI41799.1 hypothetical protein L969DRAFT_100364 [Mixia osmundae IAM 14324]GAA93617.1 hypothetical protein E5Q_00261 [Mixia osmundae IAM 14324]
MRVNRTSVGRRRACSQPVIDPDEPLPIEPSGSLAMASKLSHGRPTTLAGRPQPRQASANIYSMFDEPTIQQFKEAFTVIDQDGDGIITEKDLKAMYASLGRPVSAEQLTSLTSKTSSPGAINFTLFLSMMADRLLKLDPAEDMLEAFACFDETDQGLAPSSELKTWLTEYGDRMTPEEVDRLLTPPFANRSGHFDYKRFIGAVSVTEGEQKRMSVRESKGWPFTGSQASVSSMCGSRQTWIRQSRRIKFGVGLLAVLLCVQLVWLVGLHQAWHANREGSVAQRLLPAFIPGSEEDPVLSEDPELSHYQKLRLYEFDAAAQYDRARHEMPLVRMWTMGLGGQANNQLQEMLMHHWMAHLTNQTHVYKGLKARARHWEHIPLSAFLPRLTRTGVSEEYYTQTCPKAVRIHPKLDFEPRYRRRSKRAVAVNPSLSEHSNDTDFVDWSREAIADQTPLTDEELEHLLWLHEQDDAIRAEYRVPPARVWNASLEYLVTRSTARCVDHASWLIDFGFWSSAAYLRLIPAYVSYLRQIFVWSDVIRQTARTTLQEHRIVASSQAVSPWQRFLQAVIGRPSTGFMAVHMRLGDFTDHCRYLASVQYRSAGVAAHPIFSRRKPPPYASAKRNLTTDEWLLHCSPTPQRYLNLIDVALREHERRTGGRLRGIYILHNAGSDEDDAIVDWLHDRLVLEPYALEFASSESAVVWSRPVDELERDDYAFAVDMEIAAQADVFIGNSFSSMSSNILAQRLGKNPAGTGSWIL